MTLETEVIRDFAVIMAVLASITSIFYLLKQPVILGYILSGIIVRALHPALQPSKPDRLLEGVCRVRSHPSSLRYRPRFPYRKASQCRQGRCRSRFAGDGPASSRRLLDRRGLPLVPARFAVPGGSPLDKQHHHHREGS